ncbi:hypothetical protein O181_001866 [Austropuccinia psidii MF-1]|uniref:Mechanosensitive ion channel protein n=1 Tax=Austropuccinia psidii MF-1 TaxID=1389203 RepID=A0A9Q3BB08_9BASI|nr:hypothetical protein [Austropuccinia psidii MF-1]
MANLTYNKSTDSVSFINSSPSLHSTPTFPKHSPEKHQNNHQRHPLGTFSRPRSSYFKMASYPSSGAPSRSRSFTISTEADRPTKGLARLFYSISNFNIVIRWFFFITPLLILIWIPGSIGLFLKHKNLKVAAVPLVWWSSWLSVAWLGWWVGLIIGMLLPHLFKYTIGMFLPPELVSKWFGVLSTMKNAIMGNVWSFLSWVAFNVFILKMQQDSSESSRRKLYFIVQILFGIFIASIVLVAEKWLIQIIARDFHEKSYADHIAEQKEAIKLLAILHRHSHDIGRSDTLDRAFHNPQKIAERPAKLLKSALKGVKNVAQSTTTVFGAFASEITGEQLLQPNSSFSLVLSALSSAHKSRQLARRFYYSFVPTGYRQAMVLGDIAPCFGGNEEDARQCFSIFDKDENGDCSLEEIELACTELHHDRLALAASMRDLDSAVGKLDSILMFIWYIISILIIISLLDVSFQTMVASAGTLILGLSWLIGSTAQEILSSLIFLFVKHPYDVSDRVDVDGVSYVVQEIQLLYTVFRQTDGKIAQLPHSVLNTKRVVNIKRSGPISEPFTWDVAFDTTFQKIEELRKKMMEFVQTERRDFLKGFDITIEDFEGQEKLTLKAKINYKSNWQNGSLKAQRRNKWICALKQVMAELEIYGPAGAGNPNPKPEPTLIQLLDSSNLTAPTLPHSPKKPFHIQTVELASKDSVIEGDEGEDGSPPLNYIPLSPFQSTGQADNSSLTGLGPNTYPPVKGSPTLPR